MNTNNALTAPQPSPSQKAGGGCLGRLVRRAFERGYRCGVTAQDKTWRHADAPAPDWNAAWKTHSKYLLPNTELSDRRDNPKA